MKKYLFLALSLAFCFATMSFAYSNKGRVKVSKGSADLLRNKSVKMCVTFDYSETKVYNMTIPEYLKTQDDDDKKDWAEGQTETAEAFFDKLESSSKGMKMVKNQSQATHKMIVHIVDLDLGNGAAGYWGMGKAGGCIVTATIDIVNIATDTVVCTISVDKLKGQGSSMWSIASTDNLRRKLVYKLMAKEIAELK